MHFSGTGAPSDEQHLAAEQGMFTSGWVLKSFGHPNDYLSPRSFYKGGCQEKDLPIELKPSENFGIQPRPPASPVRCE